MKNKNIKLEIRSFEYIDEDILCVTVEDDKGVIYSGNLEAIDTELK